MTEIQRIIRHLLEHDEFEDDEFDDDNWKDVAGADLPALMEEAGFVKRGEFTWSYSINKWMTTFVQCMGQNEWWGRIMFESMVLNEFKGTEMHVARWLEASGNWPTNHFSQWNRFAASAAGKGIRENEIICQSTR